jgi:hypothetical protein
MRPTHETDRPPLMDAARARRDAEFDAPYRPGPIAGPPRLPPLALTVPVALGAAVALAILLYVLLAPAPAPLALPVAAAEPTATAAGAAPAAAPTEAAATTPAWWSPGGDRAGDLELAAGAIPVGLCYAFPELVQVEVMGQRVWVDAQASGMAAIFGLAALPYAPGDCAPPEPPTPEPAPVYVAPAPVYVAPDPTAEPIPTEPAMGPCPPPFSPDGCRNLVGFPQG